jgi:hypothetical protein
LLPRRSKTGYKEDAGSKTEQEYSKEYKTDIQNRTQDRNTNRLQKTKIKECNIPHNQSTQIETEPPHSSSKPDFSKEMSVNTPKRQQKYISLLRKMKSAIDKGNKVRGKKVGGSV